MIELYGQSLIGRGRAEFGQPLFRAINPATGGALDPAFGTASLEDIDRSCYLATHAFHELASFNGHRRAKFLRAIAENLLAEAPAIVERANLETGLSEPRLQSELKRTAGQMELFAGLLEEGSWVRACIDEADRERKPVPRPDVRSMLRPLGPVAVFGASNFPLSFSVAGGDTASAFAAGNPVIVKVHPAHPGTSEIVGTLVRKAVKDQDLPSGMFSLLFDAGVEIGTSLVKHPAIKAVAFTGSVTGGRALMRLTAERPEPIPCYAEMGSTNPLFILPNAMRQRGAQIAHDLQSSFTLGSGQFCTKPGVVFLPEDQSATFEQTLRESVAGEPFLMLTHGIAQKYHRAIGQRLARAEARIITGSLESDQEQARCGATIFRVSLDDFVAHHEFEEEVFGPTTLLVHYGKESDLLAAAKRLGGHLTATIHGTEEDLARTGELIQLLEAKVSRIIFNGFPTGVEVCHAMVHGGPFPATSDGRSTSVGTQAILRFVRPVCYQDFPDAALPPELQRANPLYLMRFVNGNFTRT